MSLSKWLTCAGVLSIAVTVPTTDSVMHPTMGPEDRFLLCARSVFQKTVLRSPILPWTATRLACPQAPDALSAALREEGFELYEGPDWLFVMTARFPGMTYHQWTSLRLHLSVENRRSPGARLVPQEEAERIAHAVFASARPIPVSLGTLPYEDNGALDEAIPVAVDAAPLGRAAESIVTIFNQSSRARVTYGEMRDGAYVPLWDSPLTNGFDLAWSYRDIDGNGTKEIVLWSNWLPHSHVLSIFDLDGHELTRQNGCRPGPPRGFDPAGGTCPIFGDEIEIQPSSNGKPGDIVVTGLVDDEPGEGLHTYRFSTGRYRLVPRRPRPKKLD